MLCCKIILPSLLSNSEVEKLKQASFKNIVSRQVAELSNNSFSHVVLKIQNLKFNFFTIQLDKITDFTNLAQLSIYACYIHKKHLKDEFLFCKSFLTNTTAKDIFTSTLSNFNGSTLLYFHQ